MLVRVLLMLMLLVLEAVDEDDRLFDTETELVTEMELVTDRLGVTVAVVDLVGL